MEHSRLQNTLGRSPANNSIYLICVCKRKTNLITFLPLRFSAHSTHNWRPDVAQGNIRRVLIYKWLSVDWYSKFFLKKSNLRKWITSFSWSLIHDRKSLILIYSSSHALVPYWFEIVTCWQFSHLLVTEHKCSIIISLSPLSITQVMSI